MSSDDTDRIRALSLRHDLTGGTAVMTPGVASLGVEGRIGPQCHGEVLSVAAHPMASECV